MKNLFKKIIIISLLIIIGQFTVINKADAYVRVKSYFRKDGTYVQSHVRSNPNGLKYDNYSWTPSQGLYNKTYGTRGSTWDTPTWTTDSEYYIGKTIYENNNLVTPSQTTETKKSDIQIPENASLNYLGNGWVCNSGFYKSGDSCIKVDIPANASLNYLGNGWVCNSGYYKSGNSCVVVIIPTNGSLNYLGNGWICNYGYYKSENSCNKINVPANASLNYFGNGWVCNSGYRKSGNNCILK